MRVGVIEPCIGEVGLGLLLSTLMLSHALWRTEVLVILCNSHTELLSSGFDSCEVPFPPRETNNIAHGLGDQTPSRISQAPMGHVRKSGHSDSSGGKLRHGGHCLGDARGGVGHWRERNRRLLIEQGGLVCHGHGRAKDGLCLRVVVLCEVSEAASGWAVNHKREDATGCAVTRVALRRDGDESEGKQVDEVD